MSRLRTGHGPDDWTPNVPSSALIRHRTYAVVPAETVGNMRPVIKAAYLENRHRVKPSHPFSLHPENSWPAAIPVKRVTTCAITMPKTGEPCARVAGHGGAHRSRFVMDNDARARRGAAQFLR